MVVEPSSSFPLPFDHIRSDGIALIRALRMRMHVLFEEVLTADELDGSAQTFWGEGGTSFN